MGEEKKTTYDNGILLNLKKSFKYAKGARLMLFLYIIFGALLAFIGVIAPLLSAKELLKYQEIYVEHYQELLLDYLLVK